MRWLAALLLAAPLSVGAWCTATPPANPASGPPVQLPNTPFLCWPSAAGISGSGRGYLQRDFAPVPGATAMGGSAWGWWCQKPDFTWSPQTFACLTKYCPGTALLAVQAALAASSPGAAVQSMLDAYSVTLTDWQETNDYNCLHWNMLVALQATKPPDGAPPVWRVPAGGSAVYPVINGKLGVPIPNRRAPGSALCDLAKLKVVSGAYTYGAFDGGAATEVALCLKVG